MLLIRYHPCVPFVSADCPAASFLCGCAGSVSSRLPCRACEQPLSTIHKGDAHWRRDIIVQQHSTAAARELLDSFKGAMRGIYIL